jgi:hypothetical protein
MLGAGDRSSLSPRSLRCASQFGFSFQYLVECIRPLCVFRPGLRLLPLGCGNAALDRKSGAVGAGHAEARGVASYLDGGYRMSMVSALLAITHFASMASCKTSLVSILHSGTPRYRGTAANRLKATANPTAHLLGLRKETERLTFTRSAGPLPPEGRMVHLLTGTASL